MGSLVVNGKHVKSMTVGGKNVKSITVGGKVFSFVESDDADWVEISGPHKEVDLGLGTDIQQGGNHF